MTIALALIVLLGLLVLAFRLDRTPRDAWQNAEIVLSFGCLGALFAGLFALPPWTFWFWFVPLGAFWIRLNYVMLRRERQRAGSFASGSAERAAIDAKPASALRIEPSN